MDDFATRASGVYRQRLTIVPLVVCARANSLQALLLCNNSPSRRPSEKKKTRGGGEPKVSVWAIVQKERENYKELRRTER